MANENLRYYYNASDILLMGSVDQDYYGRVTMEALSCGPPVVIPSSTAYFGRSTGIRIDFPQGEIRYMIDPDGGLLHRALENFFSFHPEDRERMGARARAYAIEHFGTRNAAVFLDAYMEGLP